MGEKCVDGSKPCNSPGLRSRLRGQRQTRETAMRDIDPCLQAMPDGLLDALRLSERPLLLTGAGMSAESGIATFRGGEDSLWSRFDPMQLATPEAFDADAPLVWA